MAEQALQTTQREEVDVLEREVAILADQLAGFGDEVERLGLRDLAVLAGGLTTLCGSVSTLLQIVRTQIDQAEAPSAPNAFRQPLSTERCLGERGHA